MSPLLFRKLVADGRCYFFRATFDNKDDLELVAASSTLAWRVKLTREDIAQLATSHNKSFMEYRSIIEKAFTDGESDIVLAVKSCTPAALEVSWKKQMAGDAFFNLGGAKLTETEHESLLAELIGGLFSERSIHLTRIATLEDTNSRLSHEHAKALKLLDEANEAKRAFEDDVMGKFVSVLNSKKKEITCLRNGTQYSGGGSLETSASVASASRSPSLVNHGLQTEEHDSGESTDEEKETLVRQRTDAAGRRETNSINATAELNLSRTNKPTNTDRTFVPNKRPRVNKAAVQPSADLNPPPVRRSTRSSLNKSGNSNESRLSLE